MRFDLKVIKINWLSDVLSCAESLTRELVRATSHLSGHFHGRAHLASVILSGTREPDLCSRSPETNIVC